LTALLFAAAGRSLANPAKQLIELNPAYAPYANVSYNGTNLPDAFSPAVGGYYVNVTTTVYGYYRLFANATYLSVQVCITAGGGLVELCLSGMPCPSVQQLLLAHMGLRELFWNKQPMDVTTLPAKPFVDAGAFFFLVSYFCSMHHSLHAPGCS
jgi:hypothetical protein